MKKTLAALIICAFIGLGIQPAFSSEIGVVNLYKIMQEYKKAKSISVEIEKKKAELQQFQSESNKQIKDSKTELEKKSLFQKLNKEYNAKLMTFNEEVDSKLKTLKKIQEDEVLKTVERVAKRKNLDIILDKATVPYAKYDITDEVLKILNRQ